MDDAWKDIAFGLLVIGLLGGAPMAVFFAFMIITGGIAYVTDLIMKPFYFLFGKKEEENKEEENKEEENKEEENKEEENKEEENKENV